MYDYMISSLRFLLILCWGLLLPVACVDLDYDQPPAGGLDPNLTTNISIAELKARHTIGQYEEITDDVTFSALVISSDAEGNFFKQLVVSDETGGIELRVEMTDMHNVYPVGRKVYIKAKGLWLGDYNGLTQLGAGVVGSGNNAELIRIPESLVDLYVVPATYGNTVTPKVLTLDQLSLADVSTLVRFEQVQFVGADAGLPFADAVLQLTVNREFEDCSRRRLILRTSGFSSFAGDLTPTGSGSITGVLSIFRDTYQFTIRDLDDVQMAGERCSASTMTIAAVRQIFTGSTVALPAGTIRGTVISDYNSQSVTGRNLYLQDATGGIALRFASNHTFTLGAEISVDVAGGLMSEFSGLLQIDGLPNGAATLDGHPGDVTPQGATVLEVLTNAQAWESTLVRISNATLSDNTIFNGSVTVSDATGSMVLFTRSQSTFASNVLPTGQVTITAIVSEFNTPQLIIRNASDVTGGGSGGGDDIDEPFTSVPNNVDINLPGWVNVAVKGTRLWRAQVFSGNTYAQATAFNDAAAEMEAWLITPPVILDEAKKLTFESAKAFWVHDGLSVWISQNFNGTDVTGATWLPLSAVLAGAGDADHAFIPSGNVDLSGYSGTVRIGFKYTGSGPGGQTTSCRIDNVKIEKL